MDYVSRLEKCPSCRREPTYYKVSDTYHIYLGHEDCPYCKYIAAKGTTKIAAGFRWEDILWTRD